MLGGEHEDVLVHQGAAEAVQFDRATHALDDCHDDPLPATLSGGSVSGRHDHVNGPGGLAGEYRVQLFGRMGVSTWAVRRGQSAGLAITPGA